MESTITVIVSSFLLLSAVVDYFRFGAVWILSTRRLSDFRVVFHCCGFFPLQCRVDSFHSATQCCPFCFTMLWSLSTSEPQSLLSFLLCCACAALQLSGTQPNAKPWKLRRAQLPRLVKHKCQAYCKQSNTNVEDLSQRNVSIRTNW